MRTHTLASVLAAVSLVAGAGAGAAALARDGAVSSTPDDRGNEGVVGDPDSEHDGGSDDQGSSFPTNQVREHARGFLGMGEDDLPDEVRIARRGDEVFMLTEDYVLGRSTVELDNADGWRVVSVTVELPDGPETFLLEAS